MLLLQRLVTLQHICHSLFVFGLLLFKAFGQIIGLELYGVDSLGGLKGKIQVSI